MNTDTTIEKNIRVAVLSTEKGSKDTGRQAGRHSSYGISVKGLTNCR